MNINPMLNKGLLSLEWVTDLNRDLHSAGRNYVGVDT